MLPLGLERQVALRQRVDKLVRPACGRCAGGSVRSPNTDAARSGGTPAGGMMRTRPLRSPASRTDAINASGSLNWAAVGLNTGASGKWTSVRRCSASDLRMACRAVGVSMRQVPLPGPGWPPRPTRQRTSARPVVSPPVSSRAGARRERFGASARVIGPGSRAAPGSASQATALAVMQSASTGAIRQAMTGPVPEGESSWRRRGRRPASTRSASRSVTPP